MMRFLVVAVSLLLPGVPAFAQVATGSYAFGTFDNQGFDTVNVGNLNVHFGVPILTKSGRGLPFYYNLSYDSSVWYPISVSGSKAWTPVANFGWRGDTEMALGYLSYSEVTGSQGYGSTACPYRTRSNWVYHDAMGTAHSFVGSSTAYFRITQQGMCPINTGFSSVTSDGSGYQIAVSTDASYATTAVLQRFGTVINAPVSSSGSGVVTDPNGNQVSVDGNGNFTDTTGKVVLKIGGNTSSAQTFTYTDTIGASRAVTVNYKTYTVQTNFGCGGVGEYGPTSTSLVDSISLPDNQSVYRFSYEATPNVSGAVTGRLASVTLPGGGAIGYTYTGGNNGIVCADGSAAGLTRTMLSDSPNTSWTYTRTPGSGGTSGTAVVDGLGNNLTYNFVAATVPSGAQQPGAYFYEVQRNAWNGAASGQAIFAKETCYNGAATPCVSTAIALPIASLDTYQSPNGGGLAGSTVNYNSYGGQTEIDVYDYATSGGGRGSLLSRESFGYGACGPANLVSSDTVTDGGGNTVSKKTYCYDETAVTATSNVPSHVAVSGSRGNLTTATTYTGGGNGGANLVTTSTYADTGSVLSSTDSVNETTSFGYDPTYTYATGSTLPTPSSGVAMTVGAGFDTANTGLPTSSTDVNNQQTQYKGYDPLLRATEIDYPDGGKSTATYYSPTNSAVRRYQTASAYADTEIQYDGYGRLSRTATLNGQNSNSWYQQDTCYDGNGNVAFKSYPYQGPGFSQAMACSGAGDSYTYDSLGRTTKIAHGDNSGIQYSYFGRATQVKDENNVTRITQADGLGRPSKICEVFSSATTLADGTTSASCGLDIGGNGVVTSYAYTSTSGDPTTTVTQGAQTRTFQTDWVGRTLSTTEPERGVTTYAYTSNGTGAVVKRTRPRANQTGSATTDTITQYDTLGRPVTVTYNDGTSNRTYIYDQTHAFGDPNNYGLGYSKGRLTRQKVDAGNGTGSVFGYDPMGRVTLMETCRASTCGYSADLTQYTYDWAGNQTSATNPMGTFTYGRSPAGEVTSITSSYQANNNPGTLVSNVVNGVNGPVSYNFGNGLSQFYSYDGMGRTQGGWVCSNAPSFGCGDWRQQLYGFYKNQTGGQISTGWDNITGSNTAYGYDEFNRLKSANYGNGAQTFSYLYDRYGNRWQQNAPQGGPAPNFTFNPVNNEAYQLTYDAAGNVLNDGIHSYQYDAEGNQTAVDGGQTSQTMYDALNRRVRVQTTGNSSAEEPAVQEFDYDVNGKRLSIWDGTSKNLVQLQVYWDSTPLAYYKDNTLHFQHTDWLGSARLTTGNAGAVEMSAGNLPFGDGLTIGGKDIDPYHYAGLDHNNKSGNERAQFRELSSMQGHWMSPDPYDGSYDMGNPQSFNRYAYVLNNPMSLIDPSGLCSINVNKVYDTGGNLIGQSTIIDNSNCPVPWWLQEYGTPTGWDALYQSGALIGNISSTGISWTFTPASTAPAKTATPTAPSNPCANATLAATGVNAQQAIAQANKWTAVGALIGALSGSPFTGALAGYGALVKTGGPQDFKNQPGPGTFQQRVDAGNISFGITCPFGGAFCQFAAGAAQTLAGHPDPNGTLKTGFDTPSDNASIRQGQAMRAAGCHG